MTRLRTVDLLIASGWGDTPPAKIPADVLACAEAGLMPPRPIPSHGKPRGKRRKKRVAWHITLGRKLRLTQRRG